jgi:hypothetical protein
MKHSVRLGFSIAGMVFLCAAGGDGCTAPTTQTQREAEATDQAMTQIGRNQPVPTFDWSLERRMMTEIYQARQRATSTFSVVQSEFTGKILWSCPSIGFPIPYATQLTNPLQGQEIHVAGQNNAAVVIAQAEPNGLYSPAQSDATWVPCVASNGKVTPVYEEKHVTVFLQRMEERGGQLVPVEGATPSFTIDPERH